jgi:tetratricopeptide (TPR) repeat protein
MKKPSKSAPQPKPKKARKRTVEASAKRTADVLPDLRTMEGFMAGLFGRVEAGSNGAVDEAQEMMYDAWEASGGERVSLAKAALGISPLCADAYVLLAEEEAASEQDALVLYRQGVEAGERALADEFEELSGHFWGFLQTRPYMRARAGLAMTLWRLGDQQAAIDHYRAMLILNPNDNQGIRYLLATALLAREDIAGLKVLLNQYEEDGSAAWVYTLALIAYREQDPRCSEIVQEAWESNLHVPAMLAGFKRLTPSRDGYISMGGEDEATAYVEENGAAWRATPGAIEWLVERSAGLKARHRGRNS